MVNIQNLINDARYFETIRSMRWPNGIVCPECGSTHVVKYGHDEIQPERQIFLKILW